MTDAAPSPAAEPMRRRWRLLTPLAWLAAVAAAAALAFAHLWPPDLAGRGRGTTWPRTGALAHLPGIRLDHIFLSPDLLCLHAVTGDDTGSDHKPVVARVTRRPPPASAR